MTPTEVHVALTMLKKIEDNTGGTVLMEVLHVLIGFCVIVGLFVLIGRNTRLAWEMVRLAQKWDEEAKRHRDEAGELNKETTKTVQVGMTAMKLDAVRAVDKAAEKAAAVAAETVVKAVSESQADDPKHPPAPPKGG